MHDLWQPLVQQKTFRRLMEACAFPGRLADLSDTGTQALTSVLATLLDGEVSLADPDGLVASEDWRRLEAHRRGPDKADFIVCDGAQGPAFTPCLGTLESPERSATLIIRVAGLANGAHEVKGAGIPLLLSGPGIEHTQTLTVEGLAPAWLTAREIWVAAFPLGVDCLLVDAQRAAFLPRTTRIEGGR